MEVEQFLEEEILADIDELGIVEETLWAISAQKGTSTLRHMRLAKDYFSNFLSFITDARRAAQYEVKNIILYSYSIT